LIWSLSRFTTVLKGIVSAARWHRMPHARPEIDKNPKTKGKMQPEMSREQEQGKSAQERMPIVWDNRTKPFQTKSRTHISRPDPENDTTRE
jgi:hypothetical protein